MGRSPEGKILLNVSHSARMDELLKDTGKSIYNLPTPVKIRAINCLETLFYCDPTNSSNNQINSITEKWFTSLTCGSNQMTLIQEFCRNPFPEIKLATLGLLRSMVTYTWVFESLHY